MTLKKRSARLPAPDKKKAHKATPKGRPGKKLRHWRSLIWRFPVLLILLLITLLLGRFGILHKLETIVLDAQTHLTPTPAKSEVVVVDITDEDYKHLFGGQRPLNPEVVHELIDAIAWGNPRVIGVDLDTSTEQYKEFKTEACWPPLVWEQDVAELPENLGGKIEPFEVLGGRELSAKESSGLSLLVEDGEDKVTRRYRRCLPVGETSLLPSLPWALYNRFQNKTDTGDPCKLLPEVTETFIIRYAGDGRGSHRIRLSAGKLLELKKGWVRDEKSDCPKGKGSPLEGKIILLGGSYLGEDQHDTPLGRMNGVDIMANVIETEFMGGGFPEPSKLSIYLMEIFGAFVLIILFHYYGFLKALLFSLLLSPLLAMASSLLAFHSLSRWAYFAPILIGVILFETFVEFRNHWLTHTLDDFRDSSHEG